MALTLTSVEMTEGRRKLIHALRSLSWDRVTSYSWSGCSELSDLLTDKILKYQNLMKCMVFRNEVHFELLSLLDDEDDFELG